MYGSSATLTATRSASSSQAPETTRLATGAAGTSHQQSVQVRYGHTCPADTRPWSHRRRTRATIVARSGQGGRGPFGEGSQVRDDEVPACFDGRGRVELLPGLATAAEQRRIEEIAHALGYRLVAVEGLGRAGVRLVYERDDGPLARRRSEMAVERLRAGGPLLWGTEPPPPPPPAAPPPAPSQSRERRRGGPPAEPPPPPSAVAPARPPIPPRPPYPPPPRPAPPATPAS